jgi:site-specific recombinase XerD
MKEKGDVLGAAMGQNREQPTITKRAMRKARGQKVPFTETQVVALRAILAHDPRAMAPRDRALFEASIDSTLRTSDLLALKVGDVRDAAGNIRTVVNVAQIKLSGSRCRPVVIKLYDQARARIAELVKGKADTDYLFTCRTRPAQPLVREQYARIVKGWAKLLGLDVTKYAGHSTRRTRPTFIYKKTKCLKTCMHLLGHKDVATTGGYIGVDVTEAFEVADQFVM